MLLKLLKTLRLLLGTWLLLAGLPAPAQELTQLSDRLLSTVGIRDLSSDPAGFAWVAARQGMFRYDGRHLLPLNQLVRQGPRLRGEAIRVVADSAGTVWIGMHDGLYAFVPATGALRLVPLPRATGRHSHISALLLHRGALWFARGLGGVEPSQVFRLPLGPGRPAARLVWQLPQGGLTAIEPDSAGQLLVFGFERSWRLTPGGPARPVAGHSRRYRVQQANGSRRTQLDTRPLRIPNSPYYLTDSVLYERQSQGPPRVLARWHRNISSAAVPRLNVLELDSTWYWQGIGELLSLSIRRQRQPPQLQHLPLPLARGWNGWLCYNRARTGLYAFIEGMPGVLEVRPRRAPIQALPVVGGQRLSTRTIGRGADERLLVGSYLGTFTQAADSPLAPLRLWPLASLRPWPGTASRPVWFCSLRLPDARLVVGFENIGIGLLTGGRFQEIKWPAPHPNPTGRTTFCLLRDRAGQLWAGGQEGLFQLDLTRRTRRRYREGDPAWPLHHCEIEALSEDANGALWLATNQGLYCLQPATGALRHYGPAEPPPYRLPTALLRCVLTPHPDTVWVGTLDAGLLLLHPRRGVQRQLTLGQGLPSEAVAFVLAPRPGGVLWVGTHNGLVRYEPRTGRRSDLTTTEGLATNELNRQSSWYDSVRQRLYVGGVGGLSVVVPQALATAGFRPRLLLTSLTQHHAQPDTIRTDYLAGTLPQGLELAPGDAFADLALSLTDNAGPGLARITYRLLGTGAAPWQALGPDHRLRLQGLEPGDYTLEIKGETELGTPTRNVLRVPVWVRTFWWRRPGVWAACTVLLLAAAVGGVYGWQQRRAWQREQYWQAEFALRTRLAADLHDDVGTLLSQISMQSGVLQEGLADPTHRHQQLDQIGEASRSAVRQLNEVVWSLDAHNDHLLNLLDRMRDYAEEVLAPAGLALTVLAPPDLPLQRLPMLLRRNLYLIYKEALHNVLKHAHGATQVAIVLRPEGEELLLEITDNGQPRPSTGAAPRRSGHGLRNIAQRAAAVGGRADAAPLDNGAAPGFVVRVRVPLGVG